MCRAAKKSSVESKQQVGKDKGVVGNIQGNRPEGHNIHSTYMAAWLQQDAVEEHADLSEFHTPDRYYRMTGFLSNGVCVCVYST